MRVMSPVPTPQLPSYRITLFYGPEPSEEDPSRLSCVFNVKKRSWKSGVQIEVEIEREWLTRARARMEFEPWLKEVLARVPDEERPDYESRAEDLFIQEICLLKLERALEVIQQEHSRLPAELFARELEEVVPGHAERIKARILTQLDLAG